VDPLSHAALGRTLIALDSRHRLGRGAAAACILGALCPDLDLARTLQGWDVYLRAHQGGTHSIAGVLACGLLTASVVGTVVRGARWRGLWLAATAGALSHIALDLIAGADIRPLWPVAGGLVTLPLFAMADPWLLGVFVVAIALLWRSRRPRIAAGVLLTVMAMSGVKGALFARALRADARAAGDPSVRRADAVFGSWRGWTFFHATTDAAERWEVDAWSGRARRALTIPRGLTSAEARSSVTLSSVENLRASHAITIARTRPAAAGRYEVVWTDLRYCAASLAASEPVCGLWFGGEYQAGGQPIDVVVHVGALTQRRPLRRTPADNQ